MRSAGGVENDQRQDFLDRIHQLVPIVRMARLDDCQGVVLPMSSDVGVYMNGSVVSIDGGRTCW